MGKNPPTKSHGSLRQNCSHENSLLNNCSYLIVVGEGFFSPLPLPRTSTMSWRQVSGIWDGQDYWPRAHVPLSQILRSGESWWLYSLFYVFEGSYFQGTNVIVIAPPMPLLLPFGSPVSQFLPPRDFEHRSLSYHGIGTVTVAAELSLQNGKISFLEDFSSGHKFRDHVLTCDLAHILGLWCMLCQQCRNEQISIFWT